MQSKLLCGYCYVSKGISLSHEFCKLLTIRYGNPDLKITFENFACFMLRVELMMGKQTSLNFFHGTPWEFISQITLCRIQMKAKYKWARFRSLLERGFLKKDFQITLEDNELTVFLKKFYILFLKTNKPRKLIFGQP